MNRAPKTAKTARGTHFGSGRRPYHFTSRTVIQIGTAKSVPYKMQCAMDVEALRATASRYIDTAIQHAPKPICAALLAILNLLLANGGVPRPATATRKGHVRLIVNPFCARKISAVNHVQRGAISMHGI